MFSWYAKVLGREREKFSLEDITINSAINEVRYYYSTKSLMSGNTAVNFDKPANRFAYVYRCGTCHTNLVRYNIRKLKSLCKPLESYTSLLYWTASTGCLNVCSLGGGPGIDALGFLEWPDNSQMILPNVNLSVLDCNGGWRNTFNLLLDSVKKDTSSFNSSFSKINVTGSFLECNLLSPLTEEALSVIRKADIVSIVKFLSVLQGQEIQAISMLQTVFEAMKPNALVFFIDSSGGKSFELISLIAAASGFPVIYGPYNHVKFRVRKNATIGSEINIYKSKFGCPPLMGTRISTAVWQKPSNCNVYNFVPMLA